MSEIFFCETVDLCKIDGADALFIFDRKLLKYKSFQKFRRRFSQTYPVAAGEKLKDIRDFSRHILAIQKRIGLIPKTRLKIVAAGGGSVGDFAGFVASVYKRGVPLIHIPTTWLAAVDSSHGGKTALNLAGAKNQLGSFWPATEVWLFKDILMGQDAARAQEALAEMAKVALLEGGAWSRKFFADRGEDPELLWKYLKPAIAAKLKIVEQDPFEQEGIRYILNLGHSTGHVLEAAQGWPHGRAVGAGLHFALEFSKRMDLLQAKDDLAHWLIQRGISKFTSKKKIARRQFVSLLSQDKKRRSTGTIQFVLLQDLGRPVVKPFAIDAIVSEAERQGWIA